MSLSLWNRSLVYGCNCYEDPLLDQELEDIEYPQCIECAFLDPNDIRPKRKYEEYESKFCIVQNIYVDHLSTDECDMFIPKKE